jgi:diaminohydroxyphosphoribosylaminopyrimidine deaminase/5-amino-6-(5-phosphoribosylamino)uracil reductase
MVGCVIVKRGRVVAEGYHRRAGTPHAEVIALRRAGARARGATLFVTLEPCAHHGRTPPCAPRVAAAGLRRVVAALRDPFPRVDGRGFALLRRAGVSVEVGLLEREARALNQRFLTAAARRRPFVLLKVATTLDGKIATASGDSRWITELRQRRAARRLRRLFDGILVGVGTVLADDPLLLPSPAPRRPFHRIVLDSRLRLPPRSRLIRTLGRGPLWVLASRSAPASRRRRLERAGVHVLVAPAAGRVPLRWALRALYRAGITSLIVEGGARVHGAFLDGRLFDELALFRAPLLLGGERNLSAFGGKGAARVADALRLLPIARDAPAGCEWWRPEPSA